MNMRGMEARIVKLEDRRRRDGEFYLMWRKPGQDINAAIAAADIASGTKVICPEWFEQPPMPIARWVSADTRVSKQEEGSIYETVLEHMAKRGITDEDLRQNAKKNGPDHRAMEMTDLELDFAIFGVTVQ
jgi:hypothetical protein